MPPQAALSCLSASSVHGLTIIVTTVDDQDCAKRISRNVVEQHLAACAQITSIESTYVWEGVVQTQQEWQISCKTTVARAQDLWHALQHMHPYTVPMLYVLPVEAVHQPYIQWVERMVDVV